MINCIIVDDEKPAIAVLTKFVQDTPYLTLVASTTDVLEVPDLIKKHNAELLFLDIQMPKITGLQFLKIYEGKIKVILTTAYPQYALEGYEFNSVVDYLVKPIPYERFLKACEKALNLANQESVSTSPDKEKHDFIFVKTEHKGKIQKINFADITYIEGLKNYVTICTAKGERIVTYMGIGDIEESLPSQLFIRVHRSYIVAISCIEAMDGNEIIMKNAPRIPTAGKFKDNFIETFQKNIITK
jgi:two-component system, LytTR family, response regulator